MATNKPGNLNPDASAKGSISFGGSAQAAKAVANARAGAGNAAAKAPRVSIPAPYRVVETGKQFTDAANKTYFWRSEGRWQGNNAAPAEAIHTATEFKVTNKSTGQSNLIIAKDKAAAYKQFVDNEDIYSRINQQLGKLIK